MSKQANPGLIGAFVVGGLALIAAALMIFGGRELFAEHHRFVTYFQGSVKGLRVGSNVVFRGVRVGYVTNIDLIANPAMTDFSIPVTLELLPGAVDLENSRRLVQPGNLTPEDTVQQLVTAGLRAQLDIESWVTGQLIVNLDMHPEQAAVLRGGKSRYPEIPSIPSDIQRTLAKLEKFVAFVQNEVPLEQIVTELQGALHGLNRLANSPDIEATLAGLNRLVNAPEMQRLGPSLGATLTDLRALLGHLDRRVDPVAAGIEKSLGQLDATLQGAQRTLKSAGDQLRTDSELSYRLNGTLKEMEGAARSLRILTDYLEQHPEALLRGKPGEEESP